MTRRFTVVLSSCFIGRTVTFRRSGINVKIVKIDTPVLQDSLGRLHRGPGDILIFEYESFSLSLSLSLSSSASTIELDVALDGNRE